MILVSSAFLLLIFTQMSLDRIIKTRLWIDTLAPRKVDEHAQKREELRSTFIKFRDNISHLVSKISGELPGLTQHNSTHLDALWETASLISGEKFKLTPLEGFVLGGAILLHDSALCFEAYESGQQGIRETSHWKDSYLSLCEANDKRTEEELKNEADFSALRYLHASQAEALVEHKWLDPDTNGELYLIENQSLRKHLGNLIGQIAASHHWNIETISSKLASQQNALASFPREWRIDPIKLACLNNLHQSEPLILD